MKAKIFGEADKKMEGVVNFFKKEKVPVKRGGDRIVY